MRLDRDGSSVWDFATERYITLTKYDNEYQPKGIWFGYNLVYKKQIINTVAVLVDSNLQASSYYSDKNIWDFEYTLAWQYALLGKLTFNYGKLKLFFSKDAILDTITKFVNPACEYVLGSMQVNGKTYIKVHFYWDIVALVAKPGTARDGQPPLYNSRIMKIDADNGRVLKDTIIDPMNFPR